MKITINDIEFPVTILRKKYDLEKGLKGKTSINGCYFFMLNDDYHSFWMKDCLIPLDIVFCENNKIVKIFNDCPPCKGDNCIRYEHSGNVVLEFVGGTCSNYHIEEGNHFNLFL